MSPRDLVSGQRDPAPLARPGDNNIILLDVGDQAVRWRQGNRFAVSLGASRLIEGTYVPWTAFNFAQLRFFHHQDRLIVVAALEIGGLEGGVRVLKDSQADWFLAARRRPQPVGSLERELLELMAVLSLFDRLPRRRALVAIQALRNEVPPIERPSERRQGHMNADRLAIEVERLVLGWQSQTKRARRR